MKQKLTDHLYLVTIMFFALGFFNMAFAWLGFACMTIPFVLLAKDKKKTWCHGYCPRAKLFTVLFRGRSLTGQTAPRWVTHGRLKWFVLIYFGLNMLVMVASTFAVARGRVDAMETLRFLIAFRLPWEIPQALEFGFLPGWAVHLSFRMYSMMMTTTVIGLLLGWFYKPRTWCAICPINTVSNAVLKQAHAKAKA